MRCDELGRGRCGFFVWRPNPTSRTRWAPEGTTPWRNPMPARRSMRRRLTPLRPTTFPRPTPGVRWRGLKVWREGEALTQHVHDENGRTPTVQDSAVQRARFASTRLRGTDRLDHWVARPFLSRARASGRVPVCRASATCTHAVTPLYQASWCAIDPHEAYRCRSSSPAFRQSCRLVRWFAHRRLWRQSR